MNKTKKTTHVGKKRDTYGKRRFLELLLVFRPWSFVMTVISVSVGSLLGLILLGQFNLFLAVLVLSGMIAIHAASNIINDYFDTFYGVDKPGAPTTLYRIHPLLDNVLSPLAIKVAAFSLYLFTILIGFYLITLRGWPVAAMAAIGALASLQYTANPLKYKYRGLGEVIVFLMWGPLMTIGSYFVQTGSWQGHQTVLVISVPLGIWVALVLLANNLKDMSYDYEMKIITVPIWLGREKAFKLFTGMAYSIYILSAAGIMWGILSGWALLVFFSLPLAIRLLRSFNSMPQFPHNAEPLTARIFALYGGLLIISLIAVYVFPIT